MKRCLHCGTELAKDALFCLQCGQSQVGTGEDALLGTVVAERYLIKARVGAGTSGTVYDARHVTLQKRMAVKFLHHHLCQDATAVERFRREATTVAQIEHPHIIGVQDFGTAEDGRLYLAMEFLEGQTLADVLKATSPLGVPRTLGIVSQVADALTEAHDRGYVHRDLRPRNVFLITRRGQEDFVKVMDFGLAKLVLHELEPGQATVGMSFGDPTYLSPEQAAGELADRRSDVYALGVMAYEMLTGVPPLRGADVFATINMHLRVKPEAPSRRHRGLSFAFDAPLLKALAKKPGDRWESVSAFREALVRASGSTTERGLGVKSGEKRRRDPTEPAIPSALRESAIGAGRVVGDPNTTVLGLGPSSEAPQAAQAALVGRGKAASAPAATAAASAALVVASAPPGPAPIAAEAGTLPERPDGSGPHPILSSEASGVAAGPERALGPSSPDAEVPDPTMSQMWYSAGEAEAAQAMAEFEDHVREGKGRPADLTDPVILTSSGDTLFAVARERSRRALMLLVVVLGVVVLVVAVLAIRHSRSPQGTPATRPGVATSPRASDAAAPRASRGDAGGQARDAASASPADAKPVSVVDQAVQIDAPDPGEGPRVGPGEGPRVGPRGGPGEGPRVGPRGGPRPGTEPGTEPRRVRETSDAGREAAQAVASGRLALSQGDTSAAQLEFQRALTLRPGNGLALAGLGEVDFELGQYARAATRLKAATRALPSSVKIWVLLGSAYFRSGRLPQARDAFRTALKLSPGHAEARRNLDLVEKRLGPMP